MLAILGVAWVAMRFAGYWEELGAAGIDGVVWRSVIALTGLQAAANALLALAWRELLRMQGAHRTRACSVRVQGLSQLAKYVPGNVMHFASRQLLAAADGVGARAAGQGGGVRGRGADVRRTAAEPVGGAADRWEPGSMDDPVDRCGGGPSGSCRGLADDRRRTGSRPCLVPAVPARGRARIHLVARLAWAEPGWWDSMAGRVWSRRRRVAGRLPHSGCAGRLGGSGRSWCCFFSTDRRPRRSCCRPSCCAGSLPWSVIRSSSGSRPCMTGSGTRRRDVAGASMRGFVSGGVRCAVSRRGRGAEPPAGGRVGRSSPARRARR